VYHHIPGGCRVAGCSSPFCSQSVLYCKLKYILFFETYTTHCILLALKNQNIMSSRLPAAFAAPFRRSTVERSCAPACASSSRMPPSLSRPPWRSPRTARQSRAPDHTSASPPPSFPRPPSSSRSTTLSFSCPPHRPLRQPVPGPNPWPIPWPNPRALGSAHPEHACLSRFEF
jgi:hypothetical protein